MDTLEKMQSFKTNDDVTLKYFDTGAAEEGEDDKPWLMLVRCVSFWSLQKGASISCLLGAVLLEHPRSSSLRINRCISSSTFSMR
jgi:hypothetical protein